MSIINVFQISFEIWGCVISIIICILLGNISFKTGDIVGKDLWKMILINNFLLISDALAYIYRGDSTPIGIAMTRISNFNLFALEYMILVIFVHFVKHITSCNVSKSITWWECLTFILQAAGFVGLIITQFTGFYYYFDNTNHYQRGNGIGISFAVFGAVILICFFRLFLQRKQLSKNEKSTFLFSIMILIVCIMVQFLFYGLSLINIGVTIALLFMYLRHYMNQCDLYLKSSIEEAIKDTEALSSWKSTSTCTEETQEASYEENKE